VRPLIGINCSEFCCSESYCSMVGINVTVVNISSIYGASRVLMRVVRQ
jgi:hypothetical protein